MVAYNPALTKSVGNARTAISAMRFIMDLSNVAEQFVVVLVSFAPSAAEPAVKTAARH
jgi:hypothetical protein